MTRALLCAVLLGIAVTAMAETIPPDTAGPVLGRNVVDATGDTIGRIVDVLVDRDGRPRAALVDVGGFLGIGTRRVAVAWETLHFTPVTGDVTIKSDLTTDQLAAEPEYKGADTAAEIVPAPSKTP
jgi:hypothetical protein